MKSESEHGFAQYGREDKVYSEASSSADIPAWRQDVRYADSSSVSRVWDVFRIRLCVGCSHRVALPACLPASQMAYAGCPDCDPSNLPLPLRLFRCAKVKALKVSMISLIPRYSRSASSEGKTCCCFSFSDLFIMCTTSCLSKAV